MKDNKCILFSESCKRVSYIPFPYDTQVLKCVHVHVCVRAYVCVWVYAHDQWSQRGTELYSSPLYSLQTELSLNPELSQQPASSSDLFVFLLTAPGLQGHAWLLMWVLDIQSQVFLLSQKSFLPMETPLDLYDI